MLTEESATSVLSTPPDSTGLPVWLAEAQQSAWTRFGDLPMPTLKQESWRFASLKKLDLTAFHPTEGEIEDSAALLERARKEGISGGTNRAVFANNRQLDFAMADLPDGVVVAPLDTDEQAHHEMLRRHFMAQPATLGGEKFAALHAAHARTGLLVFVPDGVDVEMPIEAFHLISGEGAAAFPHTLIITGKNAKVTVVDHILSADDTPGLSLANFDLYAGDGSQIEYVCCQDLNFASTAIQLGTSIAGRDANARSCQLNLGGAWARNELLGKVDGKGGNLDMLSATVSGAEQVFDQRTFQQHGEQHTTSDLLFKNALFGKSKTIFSGLITVDEGAHHTDAYQTCRNLLMSDDVEANAMPGLEINADQVKCSHGSTSARIGDEEIFYFLARGIDPRAARKLISTGFVREPIDRLANKAVIEKLATRLEARFDSLAR